MSTGRVVEEPSVSVRLGLPTRFDEGLESLLLALCVAAHESTRGGDSETTQRRVGLERHGPAVGAAVRTRVERVGRGHRHRPARPHTDHHHALPGNPFGDDRLDPRGQTPGAHPNLDSHTLSHRQIVGLVLDHCGIDDRRDGWVGEAVERVSGRHAKSDRLGELRRSHTISMTRQGWPSAPLLRRPELPLGAGHPGPLRARCMP